MTGGIVIHRGERESKAYQCNSRTLQLEPG
jgi:hypothetical protein